MSRTTENRLAVEAGLADIDGELEAMRAEARAAYEEYIAEIAAAAYEDYLNGLEEMHEECMFDHEESIRAGFRNECPF